MKYGICSDSHHMMRKETVAKTDSEEKSCIDLMDSRSRDT